MPVTSRRVIGILAAVGAVLGATAVIGQNSNPNERRAPTPPPANPQAQQRPPVQQQRPQPQQLQQQRPQAPQYQQQRPQPQQLQPQRLQPQQLQQRQQQLQQQQRQTNPLQRSPGPRPPASHQPGPGPVISDRGGGPRGGFHPVGPSRTEVRNTPGGGRLTTHTLAGGGRVIENTHPVPGGVVRSVRYGGGVAVNGSVERPGPRGTVTRTFVQGGRVAYARSYRQYVWHSYGRSYAYERVVPAFVFAGAYYGWAYRPWGPAVIYPWGWQAQPWYGAYGGYFTPYPTYASLDQWMTDSIIAQNMQAAYQANQPPPDAPADAAAPPDAGAPPADQPPPVAQGAAPPAQAPPAQVADAAPPPAVTPDVKEELDAQIKVELQEHEKNGMADPTAQDTPSALKAGHVLFRIVSPLDVPAQAPNQFCSLSANDYIKRVGDMGSDGTVPVQVRLSSASDCGQGLVTKIAMNDLMAMDSEQEAQVLNALQAASKGMGPRGLPQGPATSPIAVPDGQAAPDSSALDTLRGQ